MERTSIQNMCIILLIMLGTTVTQASAEVFTVDSNGGGNFASIQNAVDNAHSGDTVMVNPGVYRENVAVNKELTLLSNPALSDNDTNRTYVIGAVSKNDVFDVSSNNVKIDGFYIIGGRSGVEREEIGIDLEGVENCSLSNNAIVLNDVGISLNGSKSNYLDSNVVSLGDKGITLIDSDGNILSNNTVTTNSDGISLNNSLNNTLISNIADANTIGVYLGMSRGNIFTYNTIMRNLYGINGEAAKSNFMVNNSLYLNSIGINLIGSSENSIYENQFANFFDAVDDGKNIWNSTSKGNFWQNYTGQDADGNGIGDTPYVINQMTESIDYMPLMSTNNTENVSGNTSDNTGGNST
jgi:nitrous oxidase accessory protein